MRIRTVLTAAMLSFLAVTANAADKPPGNWDGLVEVNSKRLDLAYLAPGADFRPYTKIMVDPTQVAFHKDWMKNMNDRRDLSRKVTEEHAKDIIEAARTNFADVFNEVFGKAGYTDRHLPWRRRPANLAGCRQPVHQRAGLDVRGSLADLQRERGRGDDDPGTARLADGSAARPCRRPA